jgi:hypothetical protein
MIVKLEDCYARAVGLPWCRKEDYSAFLAMSEDASELPKTWEQFVKFSEEVESNFLVQGYIVERAYIDPETFPGWCILNGKRVNSKGRMKFAAMFAAQKHGRNQS